jgi:hypothetical protein
LLLAVAVAVLYQAIQVLQAAAELVDTYQVTQTLLLEQRTPLLLEEGVQVALQVTMQE